VAFFWSTPQQNSQCTKLNKKIVGISEDDTFRINRNPVTLETDYCKTHIFTHPTFHKFHDLSDIAKIKGRRYLKSHAILVYYLYFVKQAKTRDPRIGNFRSNLIGGYDLNSNQGVVVYMFNADCNRSCVALLRTTGNYPTTCFVVK